MFASDRSVLGRTMQLSRVPLIVGDAGGSAGGDRRPAWIPFALTPQQMSDDARHNNNWAMIARLQPG